MAATKQLGSPQVLGTISFSDFYGPTTFGQAGPAGSSMEEAASGNVGSTSQPGITVSWVGMVLALVILRVLWHLA